MGHRLATIDMSQKVGATVPLSVGLAGSRTMSPGSRPTSVSSGIVIHPTVWPQYTDVTNRQDKQTGQTRQRSRSVGRTVSCNGRPQTRVCTMLRYTHKNGSDVVRRKFDVCGASQRLFLWRRALDEGLIARKE